MHPGCLVFLAGAGHAREATENLLVLDKLRFADPGTDVEVACRTSIGCRISL